MAQPELDVKPTPIAMGYQSAGNRDRCANCLFLDQYYTHEGSFAEREHLSCGIGGFNVTKGAICAQHKRRV